MNRSRFARVVFASFFSSSILLPACALPAADPKYELVSGSKYEVACAADADCVVVNGGYKEDMCNKSCDTDWHMAIARSSLPKYSADLNDIPCRIKLTIEACTDRHATPFCNKSGKCDRRY